MADEQMYIVQYIPNDDTQNIDTITRLKHLDNQLNEPTNQNSVKVPKGWSKRIRTRNYKT